VIVSRQAGIREAVIRPLHQLQPDIRPLQMVQQPHRHGHFHIRIRRPLQHPHRHSTSSGVAQDQLLRPSSIIRA
jgi:hypothetical protein